MTGYPEIMRKAAEVQAAAIRRGQSEQDTMNDSPEVNANGNGLYPGGPANYFADITGLYEPFAQLPDPAAYDSTITGLTSAMDRIRLSGGSVHPIDKDDELGFVNPEIAKLGDEGSRMPGWNGEAASKFKGDFLAPFPSYTENQCTLIAALKSSAEAHQQMWRGARTDIATIADVHLAALEQTGCNANTWILAFTILGQIGTFLALPLAVLPEAVVASVGLAAAPGVVDVIGSVSSLATGAIPLVDPAEQTTHSGNSAYQIVGEMKAAIDGLYQRIDTAQNAIADALTTTIGTVLDASVRQRYLEAPRPKLADMTISEAEDPTTGLGTPGQA